MLLIVYTTTPRRFVIFTCSYFKLSWNTTALSQSNCRNFSRGSISTGNSMICSAIWHKYHEWYFEIVIRNFTRLKFETILKYHKWYLSQISRTNHAVICLYHFPQKDCNFTCRYFKLSWNTTALSQSNCRNFSCSGIRKQKRNEFW